MSVRAWNLLPDGQGMLALDDQGRVARWHGVDFQQHHPLLELGKKAAVAHFSPGGQWCLALEGDGRGRLLQVASGQETQFAFNLRQVSGAAFSPDGRWFAAASVLGVGQLWDTASARMRANVQGFLQGTHSVAFWPDGQRLAIGSNGNEAIKLWDIGSLEELLTLPGQGSMFNATAFSPDGSVLASANSEGLLHIWRAPSFEQITRMEAEGR